MHLYKLPFFMTEYDLLIHWLPDLHTDWHITNIDLRILRYRDPILCYASLGHSFLFTSSLLVSRTRAEMKKGRMANTSTMFIPSFRNSHFFGEPINLFKIHIKFTSNIRLLLKANKALQIRTLLQLSRA